MSSIKIAKIADPLADQVSEEIDTIRLRQKWIKGHLRALGREEPLRVLIGSNSLACGGAEHQILRLMPHLIYLGLEVEHLYYGAPHFLKPQFEDRGLCSYFLDRDAMGQWYFWKSAVSLIRQRAYDVVHAFSETANFYVRGAGAIARAPVLIAGWRNRIMDNRLKWRLPISLLNMVSCSWVINAASNSEALEKLWGMRRLRTYVVPNALEFSDRDYTVAETLDEELTAWIKGRMIVGTVGRIADQKNFDLFFDAAKRISAQRQDVCFCLVGGPAGDPATVALDRHLRQRVEMEKLTGFVYILGRSDNVAGFLPHISVLLCTSNFEGCPNAVIEGMRAGKPVVMTDCCNTELLVEEGRSGYVVPLGDVEALSRRTNELLDDPEKCRRFGFYAHQLSEKHFRAENSAWLMALIYIKEWERFKQRRRGRR